MKKVISTAFLIAAVAISSFSQFRIGANLGINIPANGFSGASAGFGGYASGRYLLSNEKLAIGLDLGYYTLGSGTSGISLSQLPILASGEYYFATEKFKPFIGAKFGLVSFSESATYYGYSASASTLDLAFGPQAGFAYGVSDNVDVNLTAQYLFIAASSAAGILPITVGISYKFGK